MPRIANRFAKVARSGCGNFALVFFHPAGVEEYSNTVGFIRYGKQMGFENKAYLF